MLKIIIKSLLIVETAIYSFLFAVYLAYGYVRSIWDWSDGDEGILFIMILFSLIFLIILLFISIIGRILNKHTLDKNNRGSLVLVVVLSLLLIPIIKDSPSVKNDYSLADLKVPPENAEESYKALNRLYSDMEQDIEINLPDAIDNINYSNVISYKKEILEAWNNISPLRRHIEQLNSYGTIADLAEPHATSIPGNFINLSGFRQIAYIYRLYAVVQVKEGNIKEGIKALGEIHSIVTKSLPCSRFLIHNMFWTGHAAMDLRVAYIIASDPECSDNDLIQLKEQFPPLLDYDKPFTNMFISEYLFSKSAAKKGSDNTGVLEALFFVFNQDRIAESTGLKIFFKVLSFLTYKENKTLQDLKKYYDLFINSFQKYQDLSTATEYMDNYTARPHLVNSSGWMMLKTAGLDFRYYVEQITDVAVKSDLLVLYIDSRLGNNTELIDRFNGQKYYKGKEPYHFFSAGIDGLPGTEDDISLNEK